MGVYTDSQTQTFRILCSTIPPFVALVTILRLWIKQPRRWWLDDLFVTLGVCCMITQQAVLWSLSMFQPPTLPVFYTVICLSQTQVWLARFSILSSIIRIAPTSKTRTFTIGVFGFFIILYLITIAQFVWVCQTHMIQIGGLPTCVFTTQIPVYQVTAAMTSDLLLCILPIRTIMTMRMKGQKSLRRRLIFIFAASIITTTVSLTQAVLNLLNEGFGVLITAELECWVSLLVCNLGVVLNAFIKWVRPETDTYQSSAPNRTKDIEISVLKFQSTLRDADPSQTVISPIDSKPVRHADSFRQYDIKESPYVLNSSDSKLPL